MCPPFLTDIDPRAKVKGSRDPLGIQAIWTRFGRHVIGNLSNASSSARDFTVLILGYHFASQVAETTGPGTELATFLKWEQLAAYARAQVNGDWSFRGTERVRRNLSERIITLSAEPAHQILSNQKAYGIWGLYSVPGRASGLLDGYPAHLTPAAQERVVAHLDFLARKWQIDEDALVSLLGRDQIKIDRYPKLLEAVAAVLRPDFHADERAFYREHLLFGGREDSTEGRQRQLTELIEPKLGLDDFAWSPATVIGLAKEAERRGSAWQGLGFHLRRIAAAERFLAPASELFTYLLGRDGKTIAKVAETLRQNENWGPRLPTISIEETAALEAELANGDQDAGRRWIAIATSMANGAYEELIQVLIAQNEKVMHVRGGAAWIEEERGIIRVRVSEERGRIPRREDLKDLWRFPYFLASLCSIATRLRKMGGARS